MTASSALSQYVSPKMVDMIISFQIRAIREAISLLNPQVKKTEYLEKITLVDGVLVLRKKG